MPLFEGMSKRELSAICQIADEIDLPAGKELIQEDRPGTQFFIMLEGEAEVRRRGPSWRPRRGSPSTAPATWPWPTPVTAGWS